MTDAELAELIAGPAPVGAGYDALAPLIREIAGRVTGRRADWLREDFLNEITVELLAPPDGDPPIRRYDPARGPLDRWLTVVIRNRWRSRLRAADRRPTLPALDETERRADWTGLEQAFGRPFAGPELDTLDGWPPRERVEVLCMAGLEHKVPGDCWDRYLAEYEAATGRPLDRPFPPAGVAVLPNPRRRTRPLAEALGIPAANTLSQRWLRGQKRLWELPSVAELCPVDADPYGDPL